MRDLDARRVHHVCDSIASTRGYAVVSAGAKSVEKSLEPDLTATDDA